ncbi:hypothetical protein [Agrococcus sp. SGAir0287]|uniref:hypothetical protein n=1 Tax=Agrococcus sp. SGAir0287 TaxID=2070347 RepID=UPI0010CCF627|nr:hypothetical protein [Agrococcus sp. SGAir0287]QCR18507.1 hypothetical protein C1N71_02775 [Agrococcus sp. SGAir0287]
MRSRLRGWVDYVLFVYRSEWIWIAAFAFFVVTTVAVLAPPEIALVVTVVGAAVTIGGLVVDGTRIFRAWRASPLQELAAPPPAGSAADVQWMHDDPVMTSTIGHGSALGTDIWFDRAVDARLPHVRIRGRRSRVAYRLPDELAAIAGRSLRTGMEAGRRRRLGRLPVRFNGRLLRLATEPTRSVVESGEVVLEAVRYFDGECSNEIWSMGHEADGDSIVAPYVLDRAGRLLSLDRARAANVIGASILAITADRRCVIVRQAMGNSIAPGAYAASGSGSVDARDASGSRVRDDAGELDATAVIVRGMLRELHEESRVPWRDMLVGSARLTGYWRWMSRAAKPELSGIVRLSIDADELSTGRVWGDEAAFTASTTTVDLAALTTPDSQDRSALVASLRSALEAAEESMPEERRSKVVSMNPSLEQTWVCAAAFLAANPGWLDDQPTAPASERVE